MRGGPGGPPRKRKTRESGLLGEAVRACFSLIVWLAATLNFFLPRLSGQDPVRAKLLQQAQLGGYVQTGSRPW